MIRVIPEGNLVAASIPLFFFFLPILGGGGIGFFLACSPLLFLDGSCLLT